MAQIDTNDPREQTKFALIAALILSGLGSLRWYFTGAAPIWLFVIAGLFLVFGFAAPRAVQPVFAAWMAFAEALNWVVTRLLLGLVFFLLFVPVRLLRQVFGHDALKRKWDPDVSTYWEDAEPQPNDIESYRRQY